MGALPRLRFGLVYDWQRTACGACLLRGSDQRMDNISHWILRLGWLLGAWLFCVGAAVGSFLNVVVYRLPAGKSLVRPGSHCPRCGHPIRWYHNIPIVSWLVLRGRCYDCRAKISPRYPLVELAGGLMFVGLAAIEIWAPLSKPPSRRRSCGIRAGPCCSHDIAIIFGF